MIQLRKSQMEETPEAKYGEEIQHVHVPSRQPYLQALPPAPHPRSFILFSR